MAQEKPETGPVGTSASVVRIDGKAFEGRPITNIVQGLQGLVPGLTVIGADGAPGQDGGTILIHGAGSLNGTSPYVLVDGVETWSLNTVDPSDVESITVIKDGSAAALYGSKAAGGVILVTTKRGTGSDIRVSYNGYAGIQNPTMLVGRTDAYESAVLYNAALQRSGLEPYYDDWAEVLALKKSGGAETTDWNSLAYKRGLLTRHSVNVAGGTDLVDFMTSAGYLYQDGVLPGAGRNQFNFRTNLGINVTKRLKAYVNLAYTNNRYTEPASTQSEKVESVIEALNTMPVMMASRTADGGYNTVNGVNPMAWLDNGIKSENHTSHFNGTVGFDWNFIDCLTAKVNVSYVNEAIKNNYLQKHIVYNALAESDPASLTLGKAVRSRIDADARLAYSQDFGGHHLGAYAGWRLEKYKLTSTTNYRSNLPYNELTDIDAGDPSTAEVDGFTRNLNMVSALAGISYSYKGRYFLDAGLRADGSSRFSPRNRWGVYPTVSAAWNMAAERWMGEGNGAVRTLKIRASWGVSGNQDALPDLYYPLSGEYAADMFYPMASPDYPYGVSYYKGVRRVVYDLGDLRCEKTVFLGAGIDLDLACGFSAQLDFYDRTTTNVIQGVSGPLETSPEQVSAANLGGVHNSGVDLALSFDRQFGRDWHVSVGGNVSYNRNRLLLPGEKGLVDGGCQVGSHHVWQWSGKTFTDQTSNPFGIPYRAGDFIYDDVDGDGELTTDDMIFTRNSSIPSVNYGFHLGFEWKGLDFSMLWQGAAMVSRMYEPSFYGNALTTETHPVSNWINSADMPLAYLPGTSSNDPSVVPSTIWVHNASYLRLKNVQLGYSFRFRNGVMKRLRIYFSAENLFTKSSLPFSLDPEAESGYSYPALRTHSFGLNISF